MKKIILDFTSKIKNYEDIVQEAFNKNIFNFVVSKDTINDFTSYKNLNRYSKDTILPVDNLIYEEKDSIPTIQTKSIRKGYYKELKTKEDEKFLINLSKLDILDFIIVSASDWKVIPYENLIAEMHGQDTELIAEVKSVEEAELMLNVLEIGVDGILIKPVNVSDIGNLKSLIQMSHNIDITMAKVVKIQAIPESERVCVDTTSLLKAGEGLLVGSTAKGFALIHAEVFDTKFVASRPFRVNAGDVSAYVLVPSEDEGEYRTKYLSELKGGDKVIVVDLQGNARTVTVGRVKIETRPMLRFELEATLENSKIQFSCICQNAETIRLITNDGIPKSVVYINEGDEILVHLGPGATHFGKAISEKIIEK